MNKETLEKILDPMSTNIPRIEASLNAAADVAMSVARDVEHMIDYLLRSRVVTDVELDLDRITGVSFSTTQLSLELEAMQNKAHRIQVELRESIKELSRTVDNAITEAYLVILTSLDGLETMGIVEFTAKGEGEAWDAATTWVAGRPIVDGGKTQCLQLFLNEGGDLPRLLGQSVIGPSGD